MKKKESNDLHARAVRLCEGAAVPCSGHFVVLRNTPEGVTPCYVCEMDSACDMEMTDLCGECEAYDHKRHYLAFANKNRNIEYK